MTETKRIRWSDGAEASIVACFGSVGTLGPHVFQILRPVFKDDEWVLGALLPGMEHMHSYADNPDELKATAERWLEEFTSSLGAVFPDEPAKPTWHDGWTSASRDGDGNLILRYEPSGGLYRILPIEET